MTCPFHVMFHFSTLMPKKTAYKRSGIHIILRCTISLQFEQVLHIQQSQSSHKLCFHHVPPCFLVWRFSKALAKSFIPVTASLSVFLSFILPLSYMHSLLFLNTFGRSINSAAFPGERGMICYSLLWLWVYFDRKRQREKERGIKLRGNRRTGNSSFPSVFQGRSLFSRHLDAAAVLKTRV